jgi:hypothetical protein
MIKHPMQPIEYTLDGVIRFKKNAIVDFLLNWASDRGMSLNEIAIMRHRGQFSQEDYEQLMQLIGYSVSGYGDLMYSGSVGEHSVEIAKLAAHELYIKEGNKL